MAGNQEIPDSERVKELQQALSDVRDRIQLVHTSASAPNVTQPTLVAVSKYKPASDILACLMAGGQLDFGENYVQELVEKAEKLPREIRWHFIGTLQSNKAKTLASIPNLYAIQTLTSIKAANALNKALPEERERFLRVFIQVNTSGEDTKSGLLPLSKQAVDTDSELIQLAKHIIQDCPRLQFEGLMTIGAIEQSLSSAHGSSQNDDFETLKQTRDVLQVALEKEFGKPSPVKRWGREGDGQLLLSMGMSSDFEAAIKAGSNIVRVGSSIFGQRPPKAT
ncbi:hypothetical protein AMATHDRAFT_75856 [Amanita thiersii Skay4041]|uniref:Pyridoxal phosphate homeostasis protein n=1 Tax=Amanita thiersii Skay4041 TaxID=703135 RepID=A0A2A9NQP9_9AGAR|nr:hypothetical protein AMATHDRAFT_75856 [Amanita thiersii Skay4041]